MPNIHIPGPSSGDIFTITIVMIMILIVVFASEDTYPWRVLGGYFYNYYCELGSNSSIAFPPSKVNLAMSNSKPSKASPQSIADSAGLNSAAKKEKFLFVVMDNCVGQNKSQNVLKFFVLMSILFYDRVALHYFLPGYSHMQDDIC